MLLRLRHEPFHRTADVTLFQNVRSLLLLDLDERMLLLQLARSESKAPSERGNGPDMTGRSGVSSVLLSERLIFLTTPGLSEREGNGSGEDEGGGM